MPPLSSFSFVFPFFASFVLINTRSSCWCVHFFFGFLRADDVDAVVEHLEENVRRLQEPLGTLQHPARTCHDLALTGHNLKTGTSFKRPM